MEQTKTETIRGVIFARVSNDDVAKGNATREEMEAKASISIRAQLDEGHAIAEAAGITLVHEDLKDDGVTGFKERGKSTDFQKLVMLIMTRAIDVVIVRHVDRLGRNDAENSLIRIEAKRSAVRFYLAGGRVLDPSDVDDKTMLQIEQILAERESIMKSQRLINHYIKRRADGTLRATNKTFGWQFEAGKKEMSKKADPVEKAAIGAATKGLLDKTTTVYRIIQEWNADDALNPAGRFNKKTGRYTTKWSNAAVRSVLLRPTNAGFVRNPEGGWFDVVDGKKVRGDWEVLVKEDDFLALYALLKAPERRTQHGRKSAYLGSGIVRCGACGEPMRSSTVAGKEGKPRVAIYRCVAKLVTKAGAKERHTSARILDYAKLDPKTGEPILNSETGKPIITRGLDTHIKKAVIDAFTFGPKNLFPEATPDTTSIAYAELQSIKERRGEIMLTVEQGLVTLAEVGANLKRLRESEERITEALGEAAASEAQSAMLSDLRTGLLKPGMTDPDRMIEYRAALGERFDKLDLESRRDLIRELLDITVLALGPGVFGEKRYSITHKVVTSLN
jgi:DNA invertase Pin-like site-specific DNA recombinase